MTSGFATLLDKLSLNGGVKSLSSRLPRRCGGFSAGKGTQLGPTPSLVGVLGNHGLPSKGRIYGLVDSLKGESAMEV